MKAQELIMVIRSFLKDDNIEGHIFSDGFLLDYLSRAQNTLISQFKENIQTLKIRIKENEPITLPSRIAYIFHIALNGVEIKHASPIHAFKSPTPCFYHLSRRQYAITKGASGELEICASFFAPPLETKEDKVTLDALYTHAVILEAFCDILLIENTSFNPQRRAYYCQAREEEKARLRGIHNTSNAKGVIESKSQM
ncbi:hypothetical protein LS68_009195 [Helicobacter sp. MIT 05-5293]|uniref:hypothetical protein n=1 Tax=unclassified Helicobacter TaxID=2593540 RepID=UPI00051DCD2B|nr:MULTISPECIES: hypothetical protein [unclassified Helicobacter]TLD79837.1 hypothetical protein LS68_009195 [Helicobacter sp. MIT 05-5293]TLD83863.1 hypothetical protein LS69_010005 [Helicobacter sp. MIT 05-5294]